MPSPDDKKELKGLARSIDALFRRESVGGGNASPRVGGQAAEAASPAGGDEMVWEEVREERPPGPRADDADPDALRAAVDAFLSSDPLHREGKGRAVREAAGALREADALDVLADAAERLASEAGDPPDEACIAMARALLGPGVADTIAERLGNARDDRRRAELTRISRRLGRDMTLAVTEAMSLTTDRFARHAYLDAVVAMGSDAMPVVERMAEDGRWFVVRNAVAILGETGGERAVELIVGTLAHSDGRVRREAIHALAKVGGEDAAMLVYGMIDDPDAEVRLSAAMAAGALKVERAVRPLLALLDGESDPDVVVGVLRALGQLGDPGAVNAIEKRALGSFFSRPSTAVRIAAYRALHNIGTPHARSLLVQAADDKDPVVRSAVRPLVGMR